MILVEGKTFQIMESVEADFDAMTWSFRLQPHSHVSGGQYAIAHIALVAKNNGKLDHAERLLRHLHGHVELPDHEKEKIASFFDPEQL
jgi:hypothetical protein